MKKKKIVIFVTTLILLILLCATYLIYGNYRFGEELYSAAGDMSVQCRNLSDGIDDLEKQFKNTDNNYDNTNRQLFDFAIDSVRSSFGYDNMPILDNVRLDLIHRFDKLYSETQSDENLVVFFTNKENLEEVAVLREQLNVLADSLVDFRERYNQMSDLERCFASWENERQTLSENVIIS